MQIKIEHIYIFTYHDCRIMIDDAIVADYQETFVGALMK